MAKAMTLKDFQDKIPDASKVAPKLCEWKSHSFYVRAVSMWEWDCWEDSKTIIKAGQKEIKTNLKGGGLRARFAVMVLCDENGNAIANESHAEMFAQKPVGLLMAIWDAGHEHNGIRPDDDDEEETLAEKNSERTRTGSSAT